LKEDRFAFLQQSRKQLDSAEYRYAFNGAKRSVFKRLVPAGAYIDTIKAILTRYGLPSELAYLPHVESSFDLLSLQIGAVGIWQFMPATAKQFLLRVDRSS
jgi:membrane-bound lytic murein transglycosylase D